MIEYLRTTVVSYSVDTTGFRDQIYVGRGFGYFTDAHVGGRSAVVFDDASCGIWAQPDASGVVFFPGCARITGTADKWAGMYLPVGSYVKEVINLPVQGYQGIEFTARSSGPFRVQLEDLMVRDFDYHGANLSGDGTWRTYRVLFRDEDSEHQSISAGRWFRLAG